MNNRIEFPVDKDALKLKAVHCQVCCVLVGYDLTIKQMHCVTCCQAVELWRIRNTLLTKNLEL